MRIYCEASSPELMQELLEDAVAFVHAERWQLFVSDKERLASPPWSASNGPLHNPGWLRSVHAAPALSPVLSAKNRSVQAVRCPAAIPNQVTFKAILLVTEEQSGRPKGHPVLVWRSS